MTLATILLTKVEATPQVEASLQNFAAGLIIAAVAGELFPIMLESGDTPSFIGITCGFVVGLAAIYGLEHLAERLETVGDADSSKHSKHSAIVIKSFPRVADESSHHHRRDVTLEMTTTTGPSETRSPMYHPIDMHAMEHGQPASTLLYEEDAIERASDILTSKPEHRSHIVEHLNELLDSIQQMEQKSDQLTNNHDLSVRQKEDMAEFIDEKVHMLQYKLDHCRRYVACERVGVSVRLWPRRVTRCVSCVSRVRLVCLCVV